MYPWNTINQSGLNDNFATRLSVGLPQGRDDARMLAEYPAHERLHIWLQKQSTPQAMHGALARFAATLATFVGRLLGHTKHLQARTAGRGIA
jgi:hypothetical protein